MTYLNPCIDTSFTKVSPVTQNQPSSDNYSGTDITYTYSDYTVVPDICPLTVTCEDVTNPTCAGCPVTQTELSCPVGAFSGTITHNYSGSDYEAGLVPGDYVYNFKVTTGGADAALNPTFDITFTLTDPCDPPTSLTSGGLDDQTYIVTDAELVYQFTDFTILPNYCPFAYTSSETTFNNDAGDATNAVTFATDPERTYKISYSADLSPVLSPVAAAQTVTVTATSSSIYGISNAAKVTSDSFGVIFESPCAVESLTEITPVTQTSPPSDDYSGTNVVFNYVPFTVVPDICDLTVACTSVSEITDSTNIAC